MDSGERRRRVGPDLQNRLRGPDEGSLVGSIPIHPRQFRIQTLQRGHQNGYIAIITSVPALTATLTAALFGPTLLDSGGVQL